MSPVIHYLPLSVWQIVLIAIWLFGVKAMAFEVSEHDVELGQAILTAFEAIQFTLKEAAANMEMSPAQLAKCLRAAPQDVGEAFYHVSLNRMYRGLPLKFWMHFLPSFTYLLMRKSMTEVAETFGLRNVS